MSQVPHRAYLDRPAAELLGPLQADGLVMDVKSALSRDQVPPGLSYWSL